MDNVNFIELNGIAGKTTYAIIDRGNDEFTSMTKEEYDRRQAEHLTEIVPASETLIEKTQ